MADLHITFELNHIEHVRKDLNFDEAVATWLMHFGGAKQHVIAARFGTNSGRVSEVLNEKTHQGSRTKALQMKAG